LLLSINDHGEMGGHPRGLGFAALGLYQMFTVSYWVLPLVGLFFLISNNINK
jgi:hypothetical protein